MRRVEVRYGIVFRILGSLIIAILSTVYAAEEELEQKALVLQNKFRFIQAHVYDRRSRSENPEGVVLILGPPGSGKSTLVHGLANKQLKAQTKNKELELITENLLPGFTIGEGSAHKRDFGSWYDPDNRILYWVCPSLGDPRGPKTHLLNTFTLQHLFDTFSQVKVLLMISETDLIHHPVVFKRLINQVTELFHDLNSLKTATSLIISHYQHSISDMADKLRTLARQPFLEGEEELFKSRAKELLEFFAHSHHSHHLLYFPSPTKEGDYPFDFSSILVNLQARPYMVKPEINLKSTHERERGLKVLAKKLGQKLNSSIINFLSTEAVQGIINHTINQLNPYQGTIADLRNDLQKSIESFRLTFHNKLEMNPEEFVERLEEFFDINPLKWDIQALTFLRNFSEKVIYDKSHWLEALCESLEPFTFFSHINTQETTFNQHYLIRQKDINLTAGTVIIYSDNQNIYLPEIDQELWQQGKQQTGFMIASYQEDRKLWFISKASINNYMDVKLPKGLYYLRSAISSKQERIERWERLKTIPTEREEIIEIKTPLGLLSIPGIGRIFLIN